MPDISERRTPYRVFCERENTSYYLTYEEYCRQMMKPDSFWRCPHCGGDATFDDDNYEAAHFKVYGEGT